MDPDCVRTLAIAGRACLRTRAPERALNYYERLATLQPDVARHHLQMARCLDRIGMTDAMHDAARRCLELEPDNADARALVEKGNAMVAELE